MGNILRPSERDVAWRKDLYIALGGQRRGLAFLLTVQLGGSVDDGREPLGADGLLDDAQDCTATAIG
jgi:hypothetical protein